MMKNNKKNSRINEKNEDFVSDRLGTSNTQSISYLNSHYTYYVCIDYLKFRFINFYSLDDDFIQGLLEKLLIDKSSVTDESGKASFKKFFTFDEEVYLFGGREREKDESGNDTYFFEMKGHALRMFELRCKNNNIDYLTAYYELFYYLYCNLIPQHISFKRIDVAHDDLSNTISKSEYDHKFKKGFYISKFKSISKHDESVKETRISSSKGWSWRLGGMSGTHVLIYDKYLERTNKDYEVVTDSWIRVEARFHDDYANYCFFELFDALASKNLYQTITGMIGGLLELKEDNRFSWKNMDKAPTWDKWSKLLDYTTPINLKLSQGELEKSLIIKFPEELNMLKTLGWFNSINKVISLVYLLDPDKFDSLLAEMFKIGSFKIDNKDLAKVNYLRVKNGKDNLDMKNAKDFLSNHIRALLSKDVIDKGIEFFGGDLDVKTY